MKTKIFSAIILTMMLATAEESKDFKSAIHSSLGDDHKSEELFTNVRKGVYLQKKISSDEISYFYDNYKKLLWAETSIDFWNNCIKIFGDDKHVKSQMMNDILMYESITVNPLPVFAGPRMLDRNSKLMVIVPWLTENKDIDIYFKLLGVASEHKNVGLLRGLLCLAPKFEDKEVERQSVLKMISVLDVLFEVDKNIVAIGHVIGYSENSMYVANGLEEHRQFFKLGDYKASLEENKDELKEDDLKIYTKLNSFFDKFRKMWIQASKKQKLDGGSK